MLDFTSVPQANEVTAAVISRVAGPMLARTSYWMLAGYPVEDKQSGAITTLLTLNLVCTIPLFVTKNILLSAQFENDCMTS